MNKNKILHFVKCITPPIFIDLLRKSAFYNKLKNLYLGFNKQEILPSWNRIKRGELAGREILINSAGAYQEEMIEGEYDKFIFDYLKKFNLKGKVFFDIGAHIGYHTLCFASIAGTEGKTVSFEPNCFNIERIKMNLEKNQDLAKTIFLLEKAVSNIVSYETFVFSDKVDKGSSSGSFLNSSDTFWEKSKYEDLYGFKKCEVQTVTIDEFVKNSGLLPAAIKMDIEGAENLALSGAKKTLADHKPILLIEVHSIFNMFRVYELLNSLGYKIELLKKEKDGRCFITAIP